MNKNTLAKLILASSIAAALAGCGGSDDDDKMAGAPVTTPPPAANTAGDVVVLTIGNRLVSFNRDTPGTARTTVSITGLQAGENLVGIDYRPADGLLYGVGSSGRIYTLNPETGAATLKSTLAADSSDTGAPFTALAGTDFGVDFNPVADRLRVVAIPGRACASTSIPAQRRPTATSTAGPRTRRSPARPIPIRSRARPAPPCTRSIA